MQYPRMDIRYARPDDVEEIATLWCEAFPGSRSMAERMRMLETGGQYGGIETVLVARDPAGRLAGACKIYRMTQHLAGVAFPMMGLAAVAVSPFARRRGLGAALCSAALHEARARGDALSSLYPFRPSYYQRLGWGLAGRMLRHRFRTDALPDYEEGRSVRPARLPDDADAIADCYGRVAARSNGLLLRDRRIWAYRLSGQELGVRPVDEEAALGGKRGGRDRIAVCDDGGVRGYIIVRSSPARSPDEASLAVRELIAEDESAYRALLGHVAAQRDQWPRGLHYARPEEGFGDRLSDPRPPRFTGSRSLWFPTATVVRGPMLRAVDLEVVLRARPMAAARGLTLGLAVSDPQLPDNDGPWRIVPGEAGDGAANGVERGDGDVCDARLETDAAMLARILAGDVAPSAAARQGAAAVDGRVDLLDRAFAAPETFRLLDEF